MLAGQQIGGNEMRPKRYEPDDVRRLAEQRAAAQCNISAMSMQNVYDMSTEASVKLAAAMQIASDAFARIDQDYKRALATLTTNELMALAGLANEPEATEKLDP